MGIKWRYNSKNDNVYVASKTNVTESIGKDIDLLFTSQKAATQPKKKASTPKSTRRTRAQSKAVFEKENDGMNDTMISSVREAEYSDEIEDIASLISTNSVGEEGTHTSCRKKRYREELKKDKDNASVIPHEKRSKELQMENTQLQQELDEAKLEIECLYNTLR